MDKISGITAIGIIVLIIIFRDNLSPVYEEHFSVFLSLLFLLSGFLWTATQMYLHEANSYDSLTCESIERFNSENSEFRENPEKCIAQMYYWKSISFRMHAIFYKLATMILLVYVMLLLLFFLFLSSFNTLNEEHQTWIFCFLSIEALVSTLYLICKYEKAEFGLLLGILMKISDIFPLSSVKFLRVWPDFWSIIKRNRAWLANPSFVSIEREKFREINGFITQFEEFYDEGMIVSNSDSVRGGDVRSEGNILILVSALYLMIISLIYISTDFFKPPSSTFCKEFGFLGFISVAPWLYIGSWARKIQSKLLCLSFLLGSFVIFFNVFVALCYTHQWYSWCAPCAGDPNEYFPLMMTILPSILYGAICVNSCFYGLVIPKGRSLDESFSYLRILSILISIAVVLYLFLLESIGKYSELQLDPFLISFMLLAIALSILYVIMGYFSRNENYVAHPLLFLMSTTICFSIGYTISVFILQYEREAGTLIAHWVFLCIWTLLLASMPLLMSRSVTRISDNIEWLSDFLIR